MRNKKGFTLIELLVTIALMLSILGIAIISFINISNRKKEESWKRVKEQTELAAEEYYKVNQYYLEDISENGGYARISIGKLVEDDFLNVVINPVTGKKLNECDYVEVTTGSKGYAYKYIQNKENTKCNINNYVIVSEVGAPKISVDVTGGTKKNNYYVTDVDVTATVETGGNGVIKSVKYCTSSSFCTADNNLDVKNGKINKYTITNYSLKNNNKGIDGKSVTTYFAATNASNKSVIGSVTYKKDTENPTCGSNDGSNEWTNKNRVITWDCDDKVSGCVKNKYKKNFNKSTTSGSIEIFDKAGNKNKCNANVYVDKEPPTINSSYGYKVFNIKNKSSLTEINKISSQTGFMIYKENEAEKITGNSWKTSNNVVVVKWHNKQNLNQISGFNFGQLSDIKSINYYVDGVSIKNDNKSEMIGNEGNFSCDLGSNYDNVKNIVLKITCNKDVDCLNKIVSLNSSGFNIYTKSSDIKVNYANAIRGYFKCSDKLSGCDEVEILEEKEKWDGNSEILKIFWPSFDAKGNLRGKKYTFRACDRAGNCNDSIVDTTDKFNYKN